MLMLSSSFVASLKVTLFYFRIFPLAIILTITFPLFRSGIYLLGHCSFFFTFFFFFLQINCLEKKCFSNLGTKKVTDNIHFWGTAVPPFSKKFSKSDKIILNEDDKTFSDEK